MGSMTEVAHIKITSIFIPATFFSFPWSHPKGLRANHTFWPQTYKREYIYAAKTLNLHAWARWLVQKEASNEPVAAPPTGKSSQWECMTTKEHGTTNVQWAKFHHLQLCWFAQNISFHRANKMVVANSCLWMKKGIQEATLSAYPAVTSRVYALLSETIRKLFSINTLLKSLE